ncbi:glycosyltransferase family 2 protein [Microbacterium sp. MYb66]|jgi:glycosyltransferase involved in cell wall biosynthesis|uniref:glycosyltransferase family 2 protein n=1 Tax=Microbacterium sp. MYb66 TaxID=1848692 RepID=UPI000CFEAB07|nr:glycosyltransferase family 2 protein [Microbacterium sp. MYb66]PRA82261.1 glycosyl transferase family 2 [Microbacterium sp. MYb66]
MSVVVEPAVSVVIATRGRAELLRRAVRSIAAQEYAGGVEIVIVYDQCDIDPLDDVRPVLGSVTLRTMANDRTPGLAGGRNTGIAAATGELLAFCDDDDEWLPVKLREQVALWAQVPDAVGVSAGIEIVTQSESIVRIPPAVSTRKDFLASRIGEIHPSSFLFRRSDLLDLPVGVDEAIPHSYGEDYDLLLQLTERGDIVSVPHPLVIVHWDRTSYFAGRWAPMAEGLGFLLEKHKDLLLDDSNAARMCGQVAFAYAAAGSKASAKHWVRRARRHRASEPRVALTWIALSGIVSPERIVTALNNRGRGI